MSIKKNLKNAFRETEQKIADKASYYINRYTIRQRKIGLFTFCLVSGIFCFLLIVGAFGTEGSIKALEIDSISVPQKINHFSMDSLRSLPSKVIDSLESIIRQLYKDQLQ